MAVPQISHSDFAAFHAAHFSSASVNHFSEQFLGPVDEYYEEEAEDEDDGLGYYDDGVKRTLTDEQIAMFRHSEIHALLRERRHAQEAKDNSRDSSEEKPSPEVEGGDLEDGELTDEAGSPVVQAASAVPSKKEGKQNKKKAKAKAGKGKSWYKQNVKPDLRKRTWDKVDTGLNGLNYDEDVPAQALLSAPQRRRIPYDD